MTDSKQQPSRLARLRCRIGGHQWERVPYTNAFKSVVGRCTRCGKEATGIEAATMRADGSAPPSWLLDQDAKDELKAHYLDGNIDEDELEELMGEVVSDE